MAENVVFQQRINGKGNVEFRTKFGRSKAIVMRRHDGYFYIDMYDNRPGKSDRISIGTDELELLCNMKGSLESLKSHFPAQPQQHHTPSTSNAYGYASPIQRAQHQPILCPPNQQTEIQIIATQQPAMFTASTGTKRPQNNDLNLDNIKKPKITAHYQYEDVTPPSQDEIVENIPPEILDDFYYTPYN
ncbi:unnamed protein product [Mytilus edulis]|uniref:Uncharacterized protein n=1 Tax=Mytilus edulis TaxID=6550 RepID=A0A8S3SUD8_MYTED|nr:unnamed protein product [Mytilus edulis]